MSLQQRLSESDGRDQIQICFVPRDIQDQSCYDSEGRREPGFDKNADELLHQRLSVVKVARSACFHQEDHHT